MQATARIRRVGPEQIKRAAIVFAIATTLAVASIVAVVSDGGSTNTDRTVDARAGTITIQHPGSDYLFLEQNLNLPTGTGKPARTQDFRFLEQNLYLPASGSNTDAHWKVIEDNSWGEDFVLEAPYPSIDDVPQPRDGQLRY